VSFAEKTGTLAVVLSSKGDYEVGGDTKEEELE